MRSRARRAAPRHPTSGYSPFRGPAGFTLIELAIAVAIMGIVTSFAILRVAPALQRANVQKAAAVLATDLQYAQMVAARQRAPVVLIANTSTRSYIVRDRREGGTVFRERFLGADTEYGVETMAADPAATVEVFPNGVTTQTVTFTLTVGAHSRRVKLSRAGLVRVLVP